MKMSNRDFFWSFNEDHKPSFGYSKLFKKICRCFILFLLPFWVSSSVVFAQHNRAMRFDLLSNEQGLSHVTVYCILQDRLGFMWFGTAEGLNRWDGYDMKVYQYQHDVGTSLSHNNVYSLCEDKRGQLWVGTGTGLDRFIPETEEFLHYEFNSDTVEPQCRVLLEDRDGLIWIGTKREGLLVFDPEKEQFKQFNHDEHNPDSLSGDDIRAIIQDQNGVLWIGTNGAGLNLFQPKTGKFTQVKSFDMIPLSIRSPTVSALFQDHRGFIWIGTYAGLDRYDHQTKTFTHFDNDPKNSKSLSGNRILAIREDETGAIWVGTAEGGLNRFDAKEESFEHFRYNPSDPNSISQNAIWYIFEDRTGVLWFATPSGGVNRYSRSNIYHFRHQYGDPSSLSHNTVRCFTEDRKGDLWVGTNGGGLNRLKKSSEEFEVFKKDAQDAHSLSSNFIRCLYEDKTGTLWVGTVGGGLNRRDPETGHFSSYQSTTSDPFSISDNYVRCILVDSSDRMWVGTNSGGLNLFDRSTGQFQHWKAESGNANSLSHDQVFSLAEDRQGSIWVGTNGGGLNRFNPSSGSFTLFKHDKKNHASLSQDQVFCILLSQKDVLWVGTGGGLNRFDPTTETFRCYAKEDGLPSETIIGILEDNTGTLWMSTNKGIIAFNPDKETFKVFDLKDGLQGRSFALGAWYKSPGGQMFFGGYNGFNRFSPMEIKPDLIAPDILITDFLLFNKPVRPSSEMGQKFLKKPIYLTDELTLTYKESMLSFAFSAMHFKDPARNKFAYKLEGWDRSWIHTDSNRRLATYTKLDPGSYVFRVKGSNKNGVWNDQGATLKLRVLPPLWRTWWAYLFYWVAAIGIFFMGVRALLYQREKELKREREYSRKLKETVAEQTKELRIANQKLEEMSLTDPLTGLWNRRYLSKFLKTNLSLIDRSRKREETDPKTYPPDNHLLFLLFDLDHFKSVNDQYGHRAGDECLIQTKKLLDTVTRESDLVIRWGGEEFLMVCRNLHRDELPTVAPTIAEKLRHTFETSPFEVCKDVNIKKTISIGYASYPFSYVNPTTINWEQVIEIADSALYAAKKSGRNAWVGLSATDPFKELDPDLFQQLRKDPGRLVDDGKLKPQSSLSNPIQWV